MRRSSKFATRAFALVFAFYPLFSVAAQAQETRAQAEDSRNTSVQERERPEYDPHGLRFGGFRAEPAAYVEVTTTDNLFAEASDKDSDVVTSVGARLPISSNWGRHALRVTAGVERRIHNEFPSDDVTTGYIGADGRLDIGARSAANVYVRYNRMAEERYSPNAPTDAIEPIQYDMMEYALAGSHRFNRLRVEARIDQRDFDFHDAPGQIGIVEQDGRDRTEREFTARGQYDVTPDVAVLAEARVNERDYDWAPPATPFNRDSSGLTLLVGAAFDVTRLIRGQVAAGYLEQDYDDAAFGRVSGVAIDSRVEWFPSELTTVTLTANRQIDETSFMTAASYVLSRYGARIDHELFRNVILYASAAKGRRDYRGIDREDDVWSAEAGASYTLNRRAALRGGYRREEQQSRGLNRDRDLDVNQFFAALTLRI
ncbi:MAG: outer membrane beta-barrel protein [Hyphomonadaceae bacterium]